MARRVEYQSLRTFEQLPIIREVLAAGDAGVTIINLPGSLQDLVKSNLHLMSCTVEVLV